MAAGRLFLGRSRCCIRIQRSSPEAGSWQRYHRNQEKRPETLELLALQLALGRENACLDLGSASSRCVRGRYGLYVCGPVVCWTYETKQTLFGYCGRQFGCSLALAHIPVVAVGPHDCRNERSRQQAAITTRVGGKGRHVTPDYSGPAI